MTVFIFAAAVARTIELRISLCPIEDDDIDGGGGSKNWSCVLQLLLPRRDGPSAKRKRNSAVHLAAKRADRYSPCLQPPLPLFPLLPLSFLPGNNRPTDGGDQERESSRQREMVLARRNCGGSLLLQPHKGSWRAGTGARELLILRTEGRGKSGTRGNRSIFRWKSKQRGKESETGEEEEERGRGRWLFENVV